MNILRRKAARREITLRISLLFPSPNTTNFRSGKDLGRELAFFFSRNSDTLTFTIKRAPNVKVIVILISHFYFDFKCVKCNVLIVATLDSEMFTLINLKEFINEIHRNYNYTSEYMPF